MFCDWHWTPQRAFILFSFINILNYLDRGIIPGAPDEFGIFIETTLDTDKPNTYIGFLQSSFIIGFSFASILFGHLVHIYKPFALVAFGLSIWCISIFICGISYYANSYWLLLIARMMSGVGEASFQCVVPPFIQDKAGEKAGTYLGVYYSAIPIGTAIGYIYGAQWAASPIGWPGAFFCEFMIMSPLIIICLRLPFEWDLKSAAADEAATARSLKKTTKTLLTNDVQQQEQSDFDDTDNSNNYNNQNINQVHSRDFSSDNHYHSINDGVSSLISVSDYEDDTLLEEEHDVSFMKSVKSVLGNPVFVLTVLGYAAQTACLMGFSTFGTSILIDFGFFDTEASASSVFGISISLAGILGTPLGGFLIDYFVSDCKTIHQKLVVLTKLNLLMGVIGTFLVMPMAFILNRTAFMSLFILGASVAFANTTTLNYTELISVPKVYRSMAVAWGTLGLHLFGDVPSPILIGYLKDILAPHCRFNNPSDGSKIIIPDKCKEEIGKLQWVVFICCCYLIISLVVWMAACYYAMQRKKTIEENNYVKNKYSEIYTSAEYHDYDNDNDDEDNNNNNNNSNSRRQNLLSEEKVSNNSHC